MKLFTKILATILEIKDVVSVGNNNFRHLELRVRLSYAATLDATVYNIPKYADTTKVKIRYLH